MLSVAMRDTGGYPDEARQRLGRVIDESRQAHTPVLSQKAVGGDTDTYARLRTGLPVRWSTVRRAEKALGWAQFAADDILAGSGTPRLEEPDESRDDRAVITRRVYEEAGQILEGLAATTPEEYAEVTAILARARARERAGRQAAGQNRPN